MAFAITGYKAWGKETTKAVSPEVIQYLEMNFTATNTDVAYDLGTTGGTFWTSAGATTIPAAFKKLLYDFAGSAAYPLATGGTIVSAYSRAASAAATTYTEIGGTVTNVQDLLFNSGNGPVSGTIVYGWKMKPEAGLVTVSG